MSSLLNDISAHSKEYDSAKIKIILNKFQIEVLSSRKIDNELFIMLSSLTAAKILMVMNKLGFNTSLYPKPKAKLISVVNGILLKDNKKEAFITEFGQMTPHKRKTTTTRKTRPKVIPNFDTLSIRNNIMHEFPIDNLHTRLNKLKINELRLVSEPWKSRMKLAGRKKIDLIDGIVHYVTKMRNLSDLGN